MTVRLLALLLGLLLLAGCSSASTSDGGGDDSGVEAPAAADLDLQDRAAEGESLGDGADAAGDAATGDGGEADVGVVVATADDEGPMMVRRVEMEVQVADVAQAVTRARATATGAGGWVESEEVVPGTDDNPGYASIVLRVPSSGLDPVVTSLGELGEVTSSRTSAEDVKAEYRDVEARVATLEAGAERLRELVGQATSVEDIASLERELAAREADLDALKARLAVLAEDVSRSTITLHLAEEGAEAVQVADSGFLVGLRQGWDAFTASVTVLLTAIGALLPFLVVAALALVPLLWWRRRRRDARTGSPLESKGDRHPVAAADPDRA